MNTVPRPRAPREISRGDRIGLLFFVAFGGFSAAWSIVDAVRRIVEVIPNRDVEVLGMFRGTTASAPLGPDGAEVTVVLEQAVITVPSLPAAALWSIVIQQVIMAATVVTIAVCLIMLITNVLRGQVFNRPNTRLVSTAGVVALFGFALHHFFGNMAANGAFAVISERTFDNVVMSINLTALVAIAFIAALGSTVFLVGERLQRDTEGLV